MFWGELIPIPSRIFWDAVALVLQAWCVLYPSGNAGYHGLMVVLPFIVTVVTSGSLTNRWTLTLPMIPFMFFQSLQGYCDERYYWLRVVCLVGSVLFLCLGAMLSLLFLAVQLPPVHGEYNVGVVDLHLPVQFPSFDQNDSNGYVVARLLYPTDDETKGYIPYLNPATAVRFCRETMQMGAPDPLKPLSFMLHNYRLISLPAKRNATPSLKKMPIVVYSHGLGGNSNIYSYQTMSLASSGWLVLLMDHTDGSAPVVQLEDGSIIARDTEIGRLSLEGKHVEYVRARRAFTDLRVQEYLAATLALLDLNKSNIAELENLNVSLVDKMNVSDVTFMGHSFGGSTALTAAHRRPDLVSSVVAHEPAVDWTPDDARSALFSQDKLQDSIHEFDGGTGGYEKEVEEKKDTCDEEHASKKSLHDIDMLFLYSDEWAGKQWGGSHLVQCMHRRGQLGRPGGVSDFGVIAESCHNEFSDVSMLTSLWLARPTGLTGSRSPIDTAQEIASRTQVFLETVRQQQDNLAR